VRRLARFVRRWTWEEWQHIHAEYAPKSVEEARRLDWRPLVVLVSSVVCLILQYYWGDRDTFYRLWPRPRDVAFVRSNYELMSFAWWTAWRVGGYVLLPIVVVVLMPGERLRDYGFSVRGFRQHAWIYVALFLLVLPLVIGVSFTTAFQRQYPFYKLANRSAFDLISWEIMYSLQFLSLEFFFRGFLLHGLKRAIGAHAIWVMIVPYVMIHFEKPLAETLGAILAGLALGTLALRTRSIWCGVLIHMSVAITMDLLALTHCPADQPCKAERPGIYEQMHYGRDPR
jgi:membrane protease YdiL (CAAX protease family)